MLAMLLVAFVLSGCGSDKDSNNPSAPVNAASSEDTSDQASADASEDASSESSDAPSESADDSKDADADTDTDEGGGDTSFSVSESIPDGFPKDIPIIDGAKTIGSVTSSDDTSTNYSVSFETNKSYEDVAGAYKKYFKDKKYENKSEMSMDDTLVLTGTKGESSVWLTVSKNTDGTDTVVVAIIYTIPKK